MQKHIFSLIFTTFFITLIFSSSGFSQSEMSGGLKQYLESKSFPELIAKHKQNDRLSLYTKGQRIKRVEARNYNLGTGFRCQVFAGYQAQNAQQIADNVRALRLLDSVYVLRTEKDLYKVQVGNFTNKDDAYKLMNKLINAGITGAWVVDAEIHTPKPEEEKKAYAEKKKFIEIHDAAVQKSVYFSIQVFATNDQLKATQMQQQLSREVSMESKVVQHSNVWKVLVGKFYDRDEAEAFLKKLRRGNYPDAWITQIAS